jgi:polysaccharide pyruvyl transferase WcaK-like protein
MIYHVFANRSNIGDWLSARAIQSLLGTQKVTEVLCNDPFVPETLERLSHATARDLVIIGGGGLFMDYFTPFWEGFQDVSRRVPFCIWGVGYCDLKREPSRAPLPLLVDIISRSRLCVVRDELTRHHLSSCHLPDPIGCPTLNLLREAPPSRGLLHVDGLSDVGEPNYQRMEQVGQAFAAHTGRPFRRTNNEIHPGRESELAHTLEAYAQADLVLTGRLHGCIIGLAMGRKVLVVSGDRKIESFMEAAGLQNWVLDLDQTAALSRCLERLPAQPAPARFLAETRRANQNVAAKVQEIYKTLSNRESKAVH